MQVYRGQSGYSTTDFVQREIAFFGYKPKVIQTDNGSVFSNFRTNSERPIKRRTCPFVPKMQGTGMLMDH